MAWPSMIWCAQTQHLKIMKNSAQAQIFTTIVSVIAEKCANVPEIEAKFMTWPPDRGGIWILTKSGTCRSWKPSQALSYSYSSAILTITFYNRNAYHHHQYLQNSLGWEWDNNIVFLYHYKSKTLTTPSLIKNHELLLTPPPAPRQSSTSCLAIMQLVDISIFMWW